ncbi:glycosyl transferase [Geobacillus sp. Manikaran-105]|uniref:glycosyltransferase n=1 Tax=Geobacillus sp. Manikaran-105 TaxID=2055940 RepID=UPI000C29233D|nr:glycosyltransferase [Geobacillus sp. Manikaran-105]PJW13245.1 glycosyl transferase [Geobacillus sp. Manikaran-105]
MISVIVPVYNVEQYLEQCLETVFNQTYKNIEVIIVNDGSTDKSIDIINKYRKKYSNILYLEQENKGLSVARNLATKYAKGEYIIYIDSDDYLELDMLEMMYNKIKQIKGDVVICGHKEIYEDIPGKYSRVLIDADENKVYSGLEVADMLLNCKVMGVTWNKLFRRKLIEKYGLYFEPGRYTQDWFPVFKHISKCNSIGFINKDLYNYRIRSGATKAKKNYKRLEDYTHAVTSILDYIKTNNLQFSTNSINKFKAITFERSMLMYLHLNRDKGRKLYEEFKYNGYLNYSLSISDILTTSKLGIRTKLNLLLWKLKILHKFF